jgi:hypothetical protein
VYVNQFNQFNSDGTPNWGLPQGYGIMQVDPPPSQQEVWDWTANIAGGKYLLLTKENAATTAWNNALDGFNNWNSTHLGNQVLSLDQDQSLYQALRVWQCTFSSNPPDSSSHLLRDAIWIMRYNGNSGGDYIIWVNNGSQVPGNWKINNLNAPAPPIQTFDYVSRICAIGP